MAITSNHLKDFQELQKKSEKINRSTDLVREEKKTVACTFIDLFLIDLEILYRKCMSSYLIKVLQAYKKISGVLLNSITNYATSWRFSESKINFNFQKFRIVHQVTKDYYRFVLLNLVDRRLISLFILLVNCVKVY